MNIIEKIKSKNVNPIGLKNLELNFLYNNLTDGSAICIGEGGEGGHEGVSATVVYKKCSPITCVDLFEPEEGSFVFEQEKKQILKFVKKDFTQYNTTKKYDNVVCINVLEHFGFAGEKEKAVDLNYDIKAVENMAEISNNRIIITVPYGYTPFIDNPSYKGGRCYTPERVDAIFQILNERGFSLKSDEIWIDLRKRLNFKQISEIDAYKVFCQERFCNEFARLFCFEKTKA